MNALWVADNPIGHRGLLDPFSLLAFLAARTARVRLGSAIVVAPLHSPLTLANSAAGIDQLSGGRLVLGLGSGRHEHHRAGGAPPRWAPWYDELVSATIALLRGERVSSATTTWTLDEVSISPPSKQAKLPVWLSGHSPGAIDRAARRADGWIGSGFVSVAAFEGDVERLQAAVRSHGRAASEVSVAKRVYVHVPAACPPSHRGLEPWSVSVFGSAGLGAAAVVAGTAAECAAAIDAVVDAGAGHVIVDPIYHDRTHVEAVLTDVLSRTRGGTP